MRHYGEAWALGTCQTSLKSPNARITVPLCSGRLRCRLATYSAFLGASLLLLCKLTAPAAYLAAYSPRTYSLLPAILTIFCKRLLLLCDASRLGTCCGRR